MAEAEPTSIASTSARVRKAWSVRTTWMDPWLLSDVIYAPTASKARAQMVYRLQDCGHEGNLWPKVSVRRNAEADILLPPLHRIAERLTPSERDVVVHAYGGQRMRSGYRNHFVTDPSDLELLRLAWEEGLFHGPLAHPGDGRAFLDGTPASACFLLTDLGKQVARSMLETYPCHD